MLMEVMAGADAKDATTVSDGVPKYSLGLSLKPKALKKLKVGIPKEYFEADGMDREVVEIIKSKITSLQNQGYNIVDVSLPYTKYAIPVYYIVVPSEDSSNLGRLDGVRYGIQQDAKNLYDVYAKSRSIGFPEEVKRRIMVGTYALSAGYYDAYYRKAQKVRTLIQQDFEKVFQEVDLLVTPTSPFPAFGLGEKKDDVLAMYAADALVAPAALAGVPGLSVPVGAVESGLPVGLQILGPRMAEERVLAFGSLIGD